MQDPDSAESDTILEIDKLCSGYGKEKVINHISFSVKAYERWAVIGQNGTGKSTLIKTIARLRNNMIDPSQPGTNILSFNEIDTDGDGNAYMGEYESYYVNTHFEFRPNDNTEAVIAGGWNAGNGLINQSQGPGLAAGNDYWAQARLRSGALALCSDRG